MTLFYFLLVVSLLSALAFVGVALYQEQQARKQVKLRPIYIERDLN